MPKNKLLKIALSSVVLGLVSAQAQATTVQEAVAYTLQTSPDMLITTNIREQANKDLRDAYADYLPKIDVTGGTGQENTFNSTTRGQTRIPGIAVNSLTGKNSTTLTRREFNIAATQLLFDGWGVMHTVDGKKSRVRAASMRVSGDAQDIALQVVESFLELHFRKHVVDVARRNLSAHQKIYGQIEKRSEGGIGRKADLDQALGRLARARSNVLGAEGNLQDAETTYIRVIGKTPDNLSFPGNPHSGFPSNVRDATDVALANHPILVASNYDVDVTRSEYKAGRSPFVPRVTLDLGLQRNHNVDGSKGDNDKNVAMLRFTWNVFRGGGDVANLCRLAYKQHEAQEVRNRAHRQVVERVHFAWTQYETARDSLRHLKTHRDASIRTRNAYQKQFNIGQRTLLDLLDSENELFTSSVDYLDGENLLSVGMYRIVNSMGSLTDYIGVEMPKSSNTHPDGMFDGSRPFFERTDKSFES